MSFPTLFSKSTGGKTQIWNIRVDDSTIRVAYGYEGGAVTVSEKTISEGKNLGKKNETTRQEQALSEARSTWEKKKNKSGYAESLASAQVPMVADAKALAAHATILPMLAHDYTKRGKDIVFPCWVQAKLDGVRCIFRDGVLTSRTGKAFPDLDHITHQLRKCKLLLDGELYSETLSFQEIVGLVRKAKHSPTEKELLKQVSLWVYDCVNDKPFEDRLLTLQNYFEKKGDKLTFVKLLPTGEAKNKEDLKNWHDHYVAAGNEGLIIRNLAGLYQLGARSKDLQKYKEFLDSEYKVVNFTDGEGSEEGLVIWVCETPEGNVFHVRPRGTHEARAELFKHAKEFIGKELTVRYQELTEGGIPRFPIGLTFRDYE
jgi:DNA ligase-1